MSWCLGREQPSLEGHAKDRWILCYLSFRSQTCYPAKSGFPSQRRPPNISSSSTAHTPKSSPKHRVLTTTIPSSIYCSPARGTSTNSYEWVQPLGLPSLALFSSRLTYHNKDTPRPKLKMRKGDAEADFSGTAISWVQRHVSTYVSSSPVFSPRTGRLDSSWATFTSTALLRCNYRVSQPHVCYSLLCAPGTRILTYLSPSSSTQAQLRWTFCYHIHVAYPSVSLPRPCHDPNCYADTDSCGHPYCQVFTSQSLRIRFFRTAATHIVLGTNLPSSRCRSCPDLHRRLWHFARWFLSKYLYRVLPELC